MNSQRLLGLLSAAEKYATLLFLTLSTQVCNTFSFSRFLVALVSQADKRREKKKRGRAEGKVESALQVTTLLCSHGLLNCHALFIYLQKALQKK